MNAQDFLPALGRISLQAGVLVLLVLLAQGIFRRQLTARWRCALWMLVIVRLLLPFSPGSAASIFNLMPALARQTAHPAPSTFAPATAAPAPLPVVANPMLETPELATQPTQPSESARALTPVPEPIQAPLSPPNSSATPPAGKLPPVTATSWRATLFWVWLAGALLLTGYIVATSLRLAWRCWGLPALTDASALAVLDECGRRLGVRGRLTVVECAEVASPALFGLFRPRLLLPPGFTQSFSPSELRFVFLHELAHLRRWDLPLNWLVAVLQILHWFNPLVWFGFARWRLDRELACDALAIEAAGADQHRAYGRTILHLLENLTPRAPLPGLVGILEDKRQLRRRIGMIANFRPGNRWGLPSAALLLLLALVGLTDAQDKESAGDNSKDQTKVVSSHGTPSPQESMIDDLVNQRVRSAYGDRATLIRMLQTKGLTFASFREQVKQEVEANSPAVPAVSALATNEVRQIHATAEAQAKSLPPFTAEALIISKSLNHLSNSYTEVQLSAVFQSSNGWWHLRVTALSGPVKGLAFDCRTVEDGIRYYQDFGERDEVMIGATACPIEYPPPGMAYYLPGWLALCPSPKLPLIDANRMRRFVSAPGCQLELINHPMNEGAFGLKYLSPGQAFISELSITNNGFSLQFMSYTGPHSPPYDRGFHEFQYDLLEVTNVGGFTFPMRATCQRIGPAAPWKTREDVVAYTIDEIRVVRIDLSEEGFRNGLVRPPKLFGQDYRPKDLPPERSVGYVVTDDDWMFPLDREIVARARRMRLAEPAEPLADPPFRNPPRPSGLVDSLFAVEKQAGTSAPKLIRLKSNGTTTAELRIQKGTRFEIISKQSKGDANSGRQTAEGDVTIRIIHPGGSSVVVKADEIEAVTDRE